MCCVGEVPRRGSGERAVDDLNLSNSQNSIVPRFSESRKALPPSVKWSVLHEKRMSLGTVQLKLWNQGL